MEVPVAVRSLKSTDVFTYDVSAEDHYSSFLTADLYDAEGNFIMRQVELLVPDKHFDYLKPEFTVHCVDSEQGVKIEIASNVFARGVFLDFDGFDCVFSDNFFALTDGKPYVVYVRTDKKAEEIQTHLLIQSVYDIR